MLNNYATKSLNGFFQVYFIVTAIESLLGSYVINKECEKVSVETFSGDENMLVSIVLIVLIVNL